MYQINSHIQPPISDEKRAKLRLKKEREKTKKKRKAEEEAAKPPTKSKLSIV